MKSKGIKIILSLFFMTIVLIVGCNKKDEKNNNDTTTTDSLETITISGSTSVGLLMEKELEIFKKENPKINIKMEEKGSLWGIKDVINGTSEIGMLSRDLKDKEIEEGLIEVEIALDGIAVITNKNNKISSLNLNQLKDIYTGKITNWQDVGGEDSQIVVISRDETSGTRDIFQKKVGYTSEELYKDAVVCSDPQDIRVTVSKNNNAIGFISFGYIDDTIKTVKIDDVVATVDNVKNGKYKLSRSFLLVYKEENLDEVGDKLIIFILSKEGQNIVSESGLISIN